MSFPSSPSTHAHELHDHHEARSEVESIPIGLTVDFADEIEFGMGMGLGVDGQGQRIDHSASVLSLSSPSTSQATELEALSPTHTNTTFMTTPPTSPGPSSAPEPGPSWKGKGRAIPTPAGRLLSPLGPALAFQTPPDTTFGTPGASGSGSGSRGRAKAREETPARVGDDLPSIMPLSPSPSPSPDPRPSRVRAISSLSFSSLRETIAHRRSASRSGTASPSIEGVPQRKLSLKGLGALVKRAGKSKSRPGSILSSGVASPASSAFQTPSSSLPRRTAAAPRPSVAGIWQENKPEVLERPVRGRADTAPVVAGDYFGFRFDKEEDSDEPSREDSSDVIQVYTPIEEKPPVPINPFDLLPRELHLLILTHLVASFVQDYNQAVASGKWSVSMASGEQGKWYGQAAGLRAVVATARVSRTWHALAHDGTFWTCISHASLVPPRIGVPAITSWLPSSLRQEAKAPVTIERLDAQDERVVRLIRTAGPCLSELDLRGFVRFGAADVKRILASITSPWTVTNTKLEPAPIRSLLALTRFDTLPPPPARATNLTRLVLNSCIKLPTQALNALLAASPLLDRLEMRGLPSVTDETISIVAARCRMITWLDIGRCSNLGPGALPAINGTNSDGGLPRLRVLHMAGYPHVDPSVFRQLSPTLETLDLAGVWAVTDACLAAYVDIEPSEAQVEMARLAEVERWARSMKGSAENINLGTMPFVTLTAREAGLDPTLRGPFYRRRTALRHLNLSGCRRVSDSGLGALAHAVPELEVLELGGIGTGMGPAGLVRLFGTTRKIRRVDLEESNITDAVLEAITPPMSGDPDESENDTDDEESVQIAMRTDPVHPGHALTHLVVSHCSQITPAALAQLVRACPRLRVLLLDGTTADDRVVRFFVCATRARGLVGAEVAATDTRFVARVGLPTSGIRARNGTREWATRGLGYVDARDSNTDTMDNEDECDETKVIVKTYWSWQGVDGLLERRRALLANSGRRNTTDGSSGLIISRGSGGPRWGRHRHDERGGCVIM